MNTRSCARIVIVLAALLGTTGTATGQESAIVTLPAPVTFTVPNVAIPTAGAPATTRVEFSNATLLPDRLVRISVLADTETFTAGGETFPASLVSWTTAGAQNGFGFSGTLSATSWMPVFEGGLNATQGAVDLSWTLDAPGRTRADIHTLTVRWSVESVAP